MRNTMTCPKCKGRGIWQIKKLETPSTGTNGWTLPVVYYRDLGSGDVTAGHFDLYVCHGCGYSELYAADLRGLQHAPHAGVSYFDGAALQQGPMR